MLENHKATESEHISEAGVIFLLTDPHHLFVEAPSFHGKATLQQSPIILPHQCAPHESIRAQPKAHCVGAHLPNNIQSLFISVMNDKNKICIGKVINFKEEMLQQ
jgi:hypothetical protein